MQVSWCPLGCCNQQLLVTSINMNEEKEAKSRNTNGVRISLARALHHFVSTSLQQGSCLYKLNHMAMPPSLTSCISQHPPTFPLGSQHHLGPAALLSWRQDREAWETEPCLLSVVQTEAGTCHWRVCGPATGCHNLPFMAYCKAPAGFECGFALSCCRYLCCSGKMRSLLLSMPLV